MADTPADTTKRFDRQGVSGRAESGHADTPADPPQHLDFARSEFDADTAVTPQGPGLWSAHLSSNWNIGDHSNGGYALTPVLRAMRSLVPHSDPISVTAHFLRPTRGDAMVEVRAQTVRSGRTISTLSGSLWQDGAQRLAVVAAFGDLAAADQSGGHEIAEPPPSIPPVQECVHRVGLEQGVELPILSRVDTRVHPGHAEAGSSDRALLDGWIRLADGAEPSTLSLPFFSDAMPPSLYPLLGNVGWVPTIELTVHVRRPPTAGWLQTRTECHDMHRGRAIESGSLWDSRGSLVACVRQICLLMSR